ncbi:MAG: hypothetical protein ABI432_18320 [Flavobacteriales bacterium]
MEPSELRLVAKYVMKLLVERRFDELEEASNGVRFTASAMEDALEDLGQPLVMPPEPSWNTINATAVRNWPGAYAVKVDLWTARGRSDISVELTLHTKNGKPVIEVDDIGVR